jgi:predicted nucleic acid-binding protein
MQVFVLDSSALLRYLDQEAGGERVQAILRACVLGEAEVCLSAMQWGEVAGNLRRRFGAVGQARILSNLLPSEVEVVAATAERAVAAAAFKVDRKLGYADAFALELAASRPASVLLTADYGFKNAEDLDGIEFLPQK